LELVVVGEVERVRVAGGGVAGGGGCGAVGPRRAPYGLVDGALASFALVLRFFLEEEGSSA